MQKHFLVSGELVCQYFVHDYYHFLLLAKSFVEFIKFLFSLPEVKDNNLAFLSNHICQDPLENFFGCQRQRGGTGDNPSVNEYYQNTQALRVVNSFCRGPVRGNCRGSASSTDVLDIDCAPLQKRQRHRKNTTT